MKSRSAAVSRRIVCAIGWVAAHRRGLGSAPFRFRPIQLWPKDLLACLRQGERAVNRTSVGAC